jgi:hypothetical protein
LVYEKQDFRTDKSQLRLTKEGVLHCCQAWFEEGRENLVFPGQVDEEILQQRKADIEEYWH